MFGSNKTDMQTTGSKRQPNGKDQGVTILTSGCHFTGKLYCRGATRIGGTVEGQVIAEGLLVIEEVALITGEITAEDVVVHGRIEGSIQGKHRVELCAKADLRADISTPSLVVHDGALFNGRTTMTRAVATLPASDSKGANKGLRFGGTRKNTPDLNEQTKPTQAPDIRVARSSDIGFGDLEPEPSL